MENGIATFLSRNTPIKKIINEIIRVVSKPFNDNEIAIAATEEI